MSAPFAAEFRLLAACCRWPPSQARVAGVRRAGAPAIDWRRFEAAAARHRVSALAYDGLRRAAIALPEPTRAALAARAAASAARALAMAREELRLQQAFDAAGLPALSFKGVSLALLAYRELGVKESTDIDLLTAPAAAPAGRALLESLGYRLVHPTLDDAQFRRFLAPGKEASFVNEALDIIVELHWRLVDHPRLIPNVGLASPVQTVVLGGGALRTLADAPLFAYLCAHGASHGWFRLKWLADLAAFLGGRDCEALDRQTVALGAGNTSAAALLLCHEVLDLPLPHGLLDRLRADPAATRLKQVALRALGHGGGAEEFRPYSATGLRIAASQFRLMPGRPFFWSALGLKWRSPIDQARIALPPRLRFLHHALRAPLAASRLAHRLIAGRGG